MYFLDKIEQFVLCTSSSDSNATYLCPFVSVIVVSGKDSTVSMYKAFNENSLPFKRVKLIICKGPGHAKRAGPTLPYNELYVSLID